MTIPKIFTVVEEQRDQAIDSILLGFSADPFLRWIFSDAHGYLKAGAAMDDFGGRAIGNATAFTTGRFEGVAL